jgi:hypothetical protein
MVESAGFASRAGGEPSEKQVAAIRERLPVAPATEASVLGNRELFGRLGHVRRRDRYLRTLSCRSERQVEEQHLNGRFAARPL